jgi:hypothetical protein
VQSIPSVDISGDPHTVNFTVKIGKVSVQVNWGDTTGNDYSSGDIAASGALDLISGVREAVSVWYNASGNLKCHDWQNAAPSLTVANEKETAVASAAASDSAICTAQTISVADAWGAICCNENLNLVPYLLQGVGNDMYWPPNQPNRNFTYNSVVASAFAQPCSDAFKGHGLAGLPQGKGDPFSRSEQISYGGKHIQTASNIVFSNGMLDPWSAAGVLQSLTDSVVAVQLPTGGHHLDLFFPTADDPPEAIHARQIEEMHIRKWIGLTK